MEEGEEYFKEVVHHNFPTHAMITRGFWKKDGYGDVWCKIKEAHFMYTEFEFSLNHPERGGFAWVPQEDCKFGVKKTFRKTK